MEQPTAITYRRKERMLVVRFKDSSFDLSAELLRVYSPSAEVRGHSSDERQLQTGKKYVAIKKIDAVGNYAIRLVFDDGHDTGIYSWDYLRELGTDQQRLFDEYLAELEQANASRLPQIPLGHWTPRE